jgi:hypothetical protein
MQILEDDNGELIQAFAQDDALEGVEGDVLKVVEI